MSQESSLVTWAKIREQHAYRDITSFDRDEAIRTLDVLLKQNTLNFRAEVCNEVFRIIRDSDTHAAATAALVVDTILKQVRGEA